MKLSNNGLELIKKIEGCRLTAYKCFSHEKYYTIGYGHYGADVKEGMTITQAQADEYLKKDVSWCEKAVNKITQVKGLQNAFDALVSFTYNCGEGNLKTLCDGRDLHTIADKILLYNKSGGVKITGLVKRRTEERALLMKDLRPVVNCYPICNSKYSSIVDALKSVGVDSTYKNRKKIATANGICNYTGKATENVALLNMLKKGSLRRV